MKGQQEQNKRWGRLSSTRRRFTFRRRDDQMPELAASLAMEVNWSLVNQCEMQLHTKLHVNTPKVEGLKWRGCVNIVVLFGKRDESNFDMFLMTENAKDLPTQDDPEHMYHPDCLGVKATMIGQSLSQQVLKSGNGTFYKTFGVPSPFAREDAKHASGASAYGTVVYRPIPRKRHTIEQHNQRPLPQKAPQHVQEELRFLGFCMESVDFNVNPGLVQAR
ncbi:hypothetical protein BBJ28_00001735 [Nothophytophthora sp. Chile5]|nr:hypothetical protein BBJ28_00001735 [Nothophytophthora sp. Chile5]